MTAIRVLLILCVSCLQLKAAGAVRVTGDQILSTREIQAELSRIDAAASGFDSLLAGRLQSLAERKGYLAAQIEVSRDSAGNIDVQIAQGELFRIRAVVVAEADSPGSSGRNSQPLKYLGRTATQEHLEQACDEVVDEYVDQGYPFAQAKVGTLEMRDPDSLWLGIQVVRGPLVIVDSVGFTFDGRLSRLFLSRKAGLQAGQSFSQSDINGALLRLRSIPYLETAGPPAEHYHDNYQRCQLDFALKRRAANRLEGALGYQPRPGRSTGLLVGSAALSFFNPLGDGKDFFLRWDRAAESNSRFAVTLDYPYPFGAAFEISLSVAQDRLQQYYISLSAEGALRQELGQGGRIEGGLRWRKGTPQGERFLGIYHSRAWETWVGLNWSDLRTGPWEPRARSLVVQASYLHQRRYPTLGQTPAENVIAPFKARVDLEIQSQSLGRLFVVTQLHLFGLSDQLDAGSATEMLRLGGRNSLRGYREEQFLTPRALWSNLECGIYHRPVLKASIFSDLAYAQLSDIYASSEQPTFKSEFLWGFGLGVKLYSGETELALSLGWGKRDSLRDGKLYLSVDNRF